MWISLDSSSTVENRAPFLAGGRRDSLVFLGGFLEAPDFAVARRDELLVPEGVDMPGYGDQQTLEHAH
jgi:hypothetical protein